MIKLQPHQGDETPVPVQRRLSLLRPKRLSISNWSADNSYIIDTEAVHNNNLKRSGLGAFGMLLMNRKTQPLRAVVHPGADSDCDKSIGSTEATSFANHPSVKIRAPVFKSLQKVNLAFNGNGQPTNKSNVISSHKGIAASFSQNLAQLQEIKAAVSNKNNASFGLEDSQVSISQYQTYMADKRRAQALRKPILSRQKESSSSVATIKNLEFLNQNESAHGSYAQRQKVTFDPFSVVIRYDPTSSNSTPSSRKL